MKQKGLFACSILLIFMLAACTEEAPMSITLNADKLQIKGKSASQVHPDTAKIVFLRDSLPIESRDSVYVLQTTIVIWLDSTFSTDQIDSLPELQLKFGDGKLATTLTPTDSLLGNSLVSFMNETPGVSIPVDFQGEISRKTMIRLSKEGGVANLTGFSFVYADPAITKKVDELYDKVMPVISNLEYYKQNPKATKSLSWEDKFGLALGSHYALSEAASMAGSLARFEKRMTKRQYEKYHESVEKIKEWLE